MSTAVYRITEKKCATCRWWQGSRMVEFRNNQPYYVSVDAASMSCMALCWHGETTSRSVMILA